MCRRVNDYRIGSSMKPATKAGFVILSPDGFTAGYQAPAAWQVGERICIRVTRLPEGVIFNVRTIYVLPFNG